jgi:hypothetical protein
MPLVYPGATLYELRTLTLFHSAPCMTYLAEKFRPECSQQSPRMRVGTPRLANDVTLLATVYAPPSAAADSEVLPKKRVYVAPMARSRDRARGDRTRSSETG